MRMWMINPKLLCDKHLLGEHGEIHKFRHTFVKRYSIKGRIFPVVQIVPYKMEDRHDKLAKEMIARGFNHQSPYTIPDISYLGKDSYVKVDLLYNTGDLSSRCNECKRRIRKEHV